MYWKSTNCQEPLTFHCKRTHTVLPSVGRFETVKEVVPRLSHPVLNISFPPTVVPTFNRHADTAVPFAFHRNVSVSSLNCEPGTGALIVGALDPLASPPALTTLPNPLRKNRKAMKASNFLTVKRDISSSAHKSHLVKPAMRMVQCWYRNHHNPILKITSRSSRQLKNACLGSIGLGPKKVRTRFDGIVPVLYLQISDPAIWLS